ERGLRRPLQVTDGARNERVRGEDIVLVTVVGKESEMSAKTGKWLLFCLLLAMSSAIQLQGQGATGPENTLVEPFQIVGNVYFVSPEAEHSSYLITTPAGHILINTGYDRQVPTIRASIEKLGFKVSD